MSESSKNLKAEHDVLKQELQNAVSDGLSESLDDLDQSPVIVPAAPKFPVKVWYQSKSHKQDRYYAGFNAQIHKIQWVYAPGEAYLVNDIDHLTVVLALCSVAGYRKMQVHEVTQ